MKTQTHIALLSVALLLASSASLAEQTGSAEEPNLSVEVEAELASTYYWRGFDITDREPVLQPAFTLRHRPSGFWFNLWASLPVAARRDTRETDEINLVFGLDRPLGDAATWSAGFILYRLPRLPSEDNSTEEIFAGISLPETAFQPTLRYFHDFNLGDGGYLQFGGAHGIGRLTLGADLGFSLAQYTDKKGFVDLVLGISYEVDLGDSGFLSPYVRFAVVDDGDRNPDRSELWFGVAFGWGR